MKRLLLALSLSLAFIATTQPASAGFVIIDGTDANDHGSASGGVNVGGWLYMQRVLENLAAQKLAANPLGPKTVFNIGADAATGSGNAIASAFALSSLGMPGSGWTLVNIVGAANINMLLSGGAAIAGSVGILAITTANEAGGDLDAAELAAVNANGAGIDAFLAAGGALHSMAQSDATGYSWISSLLPGFVTTQGGNSSALTLTPAGNSAFPGLTNASLSSGPWHNDFSGNLGGLSVLATAPLGGTTRNVIIGGSTAGGSITDPGIATPLPPTALAAVGAFGLFGVYRRRRAA